MALNIKVCILALNLKLTVILFNKRKTVLALNMNLILKKKLILYANAFFYTKTFLCSCNKILAHTFNDLQRMDICHFALVNLEDLVRVPDHPL